MQEKMKQLIMEFESISDQLSSNELSFQERNELLTKLKMAIESLRESYHEHSNALSTKGD